MNKKELKASLTIEMSVIASLVMLVIMGLIISVFYFHDKNIMGGAAYETAIVGSLEMRDSDAITEAELISYCQERLGGKCIFFTTQKVKASISEDEIVVEITAKRKGFSVSAKKCSAITKPEERIRNIRRMT